MSGTWVPETWRTTQLPIACSHFRIGLMWPSAWMFRSPITMSASPRSSGVSSVAMSAPAYWLSASVLTMKSAPAFSAASMPGHEAGSEPLVPPEAHDVIDAVGARHLGRPVGRSVVDDEHLDPVDARDLPGQVGQRRGQRLRLVQARDLDDQLLHACWAPSPTNRSTTPSQVTRRARVQAGVAERGGPGAVVVELVHRRGDRLRRRLADPAVDAVLDELEHATRVVRRDDRLGRQEGLERHVAVVLVVRRVDDRQRARVELDEPVVVHGAEEVDAIGDARSVGERVTRLALRPLADHDQTQRRARERQRLDRQIDALDRLDARDREHVVAVRARAEPRPEPRRMVQRFGADAEELLEPRRRVARDREEPARLEERLAIEPEDRLAQADVQLGVLEVAERRAAQLVGRPVLVDQPGHLVRVADEVGRELGGDHQIDRLAVALAQIDEAPGGGVGEDLLASGTT